MRIDDIGYRIIGQSANVEEIKRILRDITTTSRNHNIMIIGASGMGKSHIMKIIANALGVRNCIGYNPESFTIDTQKRFHFIDECHMIPEPEILYSYLDSGKYTFIFATNEYGSVKEPLLNRCISIILAPYTLDDLVELTRLSLGEENIYLVDNELYKSIASVGRANPRRIKEIVTRLSLIFRDTGTPKTVDELDYLLLSIGVDPRTGLTTWDNIYLRFLDTIGTASLSIIERATGIDKDFITKYIEPFLLLNGYIKISSRGRTKCT